MNERTINDAEEGSRPAKKPPTENVYGATLADSDAGTARGPAAAGGAGAARDLYDVVFKIGEGGMGTLSLAKDVRLGRWVALKRLSAEFADDSRLLERFRTEARSIAALTHFHIVHVYAMAEDEEGPYIAMEYVAGPDCAHRDDWPPGLPNPPLDLEEYVKKQGVFDATQAVQLGRKLCSAVAYAHKHGVIHRDIKPANIMMNEEGEPKLADFGLARQGGGERLGMTIAGAQLLTLDYGAPEQEIDASKADERADIYALGGTLWFLVTGQSPRYFRESEVSEPLRGILVKALQKDREKRFQMAAEMEQALATLSPGGGPSLSAAGVGLVPGRCPKCGHEHVLDPKEIFKRRFCESCGNTLLEPCLKCESENGVWAKFCAKCGTDLEARLKQEIEELQADRDQIAAFRQASRFEEAISLLGRMAGVKHPRLREFAQWASETLPRIENELSAAEHDRDGKLQSAQAEMSAHNYESVVSSLDSVPIPLMIRACVELRDTARARIDEMAKLRAEIAEQLNSRQYNGLKAKVVRFLELHPGSKMQTLLKQIEQREAQEHERCWQNAERQPSVAAYEHYLAAYPSGAYVALAHERIARCKAWEQEEFWKAVNRLPSISAYRQYLAKYPDGKYVEQARAAIAAPLREQLLGNLKNVELRKDYLAHRTPPLAAEDEQLARHNARIICAVAALAVGAIFGAFVGGLAGWFGGIVVGLVAGNAVHFLLDEELRRRMATALSISRRLPQKPDDRNIAIGCITVVCIGLAIGGLAALVNLFESFSKNAGAVDAVFGGLLGALTAAGMAVFVCQFVKGYSEKATLGPLPWQGYVGRLDALRRRYLGEANAGSGPRVGLFVAVVGFFLLLFVIMLGLIVSTISNSAQPTAKQAASSGGRVPSPPVSGRSRGPTPSQEQERLALEKQAELERQAEVARNKLAAATAPGMAYTGTLSRKIFTSEIHSLRLVFTAQNGRLITAEATCPDKPKEQQTFKGEINPNPRPEFGGDVSYPILMSPTRRQAGLAATADVLWFFRGSEGSLELRPTDTGLEGKTGGWQFGGWTVSLQREVGGASSPEDKSPEERARSTKVADTQPESDFLGEWANRDFQTLGITRIHIIRANPGSKRIVVRLWTKSSGPTGEWKQGEANATLGNGVLSVNQTSLGDVDRLEMTLLENGDMQVDAHPRFAGRESVDHTSGRSIFGKGLVHDWSSSAR